MVVENDILNELLVKRDPKLIKPIEGTCILSQKHIDQLRKVFNQIDRYSDYIIPRVKLIEQLRTNSITGKFKDIPAV